MPAQGASAPATGIGVKKALRISTHPSINPTQVDSDMTAYEGIESNIGIQNLCLFPTCSEGWI